jgi:hypothetical protein
MAKESFYFTHDYNARNDDKILELRANFGAEGYGVFWMIVETMAENEHGGLKASLLGGLSLGYGIPKEKLISIIGFCLSVELFFEKDGFYFSNRLLGHKKFREFFAEKGREGAKKRWGDKGGYSGANAKERKGKEINKGKLKGKEFVRDFTAVILENGEEQVLGQWQSSMAAMKEIEPEDVLAGVIK